MGKGKKHFYILFGDSVPQEIEKEYNRIVRREEYLLEKDPIGDAYLFGDEDELYKYNIVDCITRMEQEKAEESQQMEMLELLRKALKRLKEEHPYEYGLVNKYYFSDRKVTMRELGEENNITKQAVNNSLNRAYERLKKYIIMYKEESDKI